MNKATQNKAISLTAYIILRRLEGKDDEYSAYLDESIEIMLELAENKEDAEIFAKYFYTEAVEGEYEYVLKIMKKEGFAEVLSDFINLENIEEDLKLIIDALNALCV